MIGIIRNKVVLYVISRYIIYGIQFISLIILADRLGPFNYGIWGFILMLVSYLSIINLGIANSINVYIIQYKDNIDKIKDYIASSFGAVTILICGLIAFCLLYYFIPNLFGKYDLGTLFYLIILIGALQYINSIYSNIYRACNKLFEVAFCQSIVPLFILFNVLFVPTGKLIDGLVIGYVIANLIALSLFYFNKAYPTGGRVRIRYIKNLLNKGIYLFFYNSAFYLILTTTSSFVSSSYDINQYGIFSFSYSLGHSILLLMEAFAFVIYPKVIDKLYCGDTIIVENVLKSVRINYISLSHGLMYIAISIFPFFIKLFPKFENNLLMLNLMALAIILSTNSFGYNTFLIARNKEKLSALISGISLLINIILGLIIIKWIRVPYYFSVLTIVCSYSCFALLCSLFTHKILYGNIKNFVSAVFPIKLIIPYISAIIISILDLSYLSWTPLLFYIVLNRNVISQIAETVKKVLHSPQIININSKN